MRILFAVIYTVFILMSSTAQARSTDTTQPAYQIDEQATLQAPWKPDSVIDLKNEEDKPLEFYRIFIGVTSEGYYVVQDFYQPSDLKRTDPFVIMELSRVDIPISHGNPIPHLQSTYVGWHRNGQKEVEGSFKDGKMQGLWSRWHKNNQKAVEGYFQDGKVQGFWTEWYDNGQKKLEGQYKDDRRQGLWTEWSKEGKKISETMYEAGKEVSKKTFD